MGNNLDSQKISKIIVDLSETTDLNDEFLNSEFKKLITETGGEKQPYLEIQKIFFMLSKNQSANFSEQNILNFAFNVLKFSKLNNEDSTNYLISKCTLIFLSLIIDTLSQKYKNRIENFFFICFKNIPFENNNVDLKEFFPFNVIYFCVNSLIHNDYKEVNKKRVISFTSISILYDIMLSYMHRINKNGIEGIDLFKFVFSNERFLSRNEFESFINKVLDLFFSSFSKFVRYDINSRQNGSVDERFLKNILCFVIYFIQDTNFFLFSDYDEKADLNCCFENEQNEVCYNLIMLISNNKPIKKMIIEYRNYFNECLVKFIKSNSDIIKDFFYYIFKGYELYSEKLKNTLNYFLVKVFDLIPDLLELNEIKDFIGGILLKLKNELKNSNVFNLAKLSLLNKIILTKNFSALMNECYLNNETERKACLISNSKELMKIMMRKIKVLLEEKPNNHKRSMSFYMLLIIENLCLSLNQISSERNDEIIQIYLSIFKPLTNFKDESNKQKVADALVNMKVYFDILLIMVNKFETRDFFLLKIFKEFYNFKEEYNIDESLKAIFKEFIDVLNKIKNLNKKIKNKIQEEGTDWRFSQDSTLIKIINKIMFFDEDFAVNRVNLIDLQINSNNIEKVIISTNYFHKIFDNTKFTLIAL